tara:strand:- start:9316 stop:9459 length:144 start_codon:yes stop_codon:yes gene_type:complete
MIDIEKTIKYLQDKIDRYNKGDMTITLSEHQSNVATLQHFNRVKDAR